MLCTTDVLHTYAPVPFDMLAINPELFSAAYIGDYLAQLPYAFTF